MIRTRRSVLASTPLLLVLAACGGQGFTGSSGKPAVTPQRDLTAASSSSAVSSYGAAGSTAESQAIANCLKVWGSSPFTGATPTYRTVQASVQILGGGSAVVDNACTAQPELVLIKTAVSVLSNSKYELENPNGWYCMMVNVNVQSQTTVELAQNAHIADNRVAVSVLSQGQSTGAVGVNVLSDVQVQRVASTCQ